MDNETLSMGGIQVYIQKQVVKQIKQLLKQPITITTKSRKLTVDKSKHVFLNLYNTPLEAAKNVQLVFLVPQNNSKELILLVRVIEP